MGQAPSAPPLDSDAVHAFMTCLDHLSPELKQELTKETNMDEIQQAFESTNVHIQSKSLDDIMNIISIWQDGDNIWYVGGTNREEPATQDEEYEKPKFPEMMSFYYCYVQNVKGEENKLLHLKPDLLIYNKHKNSNCTPEEGFVYVLDTGLT